MGESRTVRSLLKLASATCCTALRLDLATMHAPSSTAHLKYKRSTFSLAPEQPLEHARRAPRLHLVRVVELEHDAHRRAARGRRPDRPRRRDDAPLAVELAARRGREGPLVVQALAVGRGKGVVCGRAVRKTTTRESERYQVEKEARGEEEATHGPSSPCTRAAGS